MSNVVSVALADDDANRMSQRAIRALEETDSMSPALRACVHAYGYAIVKAFLSNGVTNPNIIRRLVQECWDGARQPHQGRTHNSGDRLATLDWLLIQAGAQISAKRLLRHLNDHCMTILPFEPTPAMIKASMDTVSNHDVRVSKEQKHRLRLRAATHAARVQLWPELFAK